MAAYFMASLLLANTSNKPPSSQSMTTFTYHSHSPCRPSLPPCRPALDQWAWEGSAVLRKETGKKASSEPCTTELLSTLSSAYTSAEPRAWVPEMYKQLK
eukprot:1157302-Pelagomonas_calceolata.AAC.13